MDVKLSYTEIYFAVTSVHVIEYVCKCLLFPYILFQKKLNSLEVQNESLKNVIF